ncbi:MAG TPA: protease pro-enzyme activation domain-containing protein, partial [Kribbella sp.]|nr:protease pro-enzyme activation domain-containing protein [Kribbella sp.]
MAEIRSRATVVAATAVLVAGGLVWTQSASAATSGRHGLAGSVPSWATAAAKVGEASGSDNVGFRIYLGWRDAGGAEALATAVSTPGSASYGKYVSAAKFRSEFAPSASDVSAVQQWLRKAGFDIGVTPGNNRYVQAEGTVAQAAAAFGAKFGVYKVAGQTLRAPESELSVPSTLPSSITAVVGLDESSALLEPYAQSPDATPSPAFVNAPPCSAFWNEKSTATTLTP